MNNTVLLGNLVKDAELTYLKGKGTPVLKYTLAVPKNMNREEVQYIPIVTFGKLAESLSKYMVKGTGVSIIGELQVNGVKQDDGSYKTYVSVVTSFVKMVGGKKKESDPFETKNTNDDFEGEPVYDSDLPF